MALSNMEMNLFRRQLKRIPHRELEQASDVRKLNLSQNRGISLLGDLSKFVNVVELYLENCCLHDIPEDLRNLSKVEVLTLSGNRLEHFESSATLDKLATLKKLALKDCGLSQLPDSIGRLSMLEEIDLQGNNALRLFPPALLRLSELKKLGLSACGLSKLPDEITRLIKLEELELSDNKGLQSLPRDLSALARLRVLNLLNCGFSEMPAAIAALGSLEELVLGKNPLKRIPAGMWGLQNLRMLSFNECDLSELTVDITNYQSLEELHIKGNRNLEAFPETLLNLPNLRMLSICRSGLSDLPREIGKLTALRELKMSGIPFGLALPTWLSEMRFLRVLDISSCKLPLLPDAIAELTCLEVLDIYWNRELTSLPSSMGSLSQLKTLDARICNLSQFPDVLVQLTSLEVLKLCGNRDIRHVPPSVAALRKLKSLWLGSCGLTELPATISGLISLEEFHLDGNAMGSFPEFLLRLSNLRVLKLSECGLSVLPDSIKDLVELEDLNISKNESITKLTKEICTLPSLKKLNVSYCSLAKLPDNCCLLQGLEELRMRGNPISDELPPQLTHLKNLKLLDISSCGFHQLPSAIKELTYLEELYACNNDLQTYPDVTLYLKELRRLDLSNNDAFTGCQNNITTLPAQLLDSALEVLDLEGNPMMQPPVEICRQGLIDIRLYLKALIPVGEMVCADSLNMIGDSGAGKTSIALSLENGHPQCAKDNDRTRVMTRMRVKVCGKTVSLNDFGGHEVYQSIIPMFLPSKGIAILAYDMSLSKDKSEDNIRRWLMTIIAKSPIIRVIVVGTHADVVSANRRDLEVMVQEHVRDVLARAIEEIKHHKNALSVVPTRLGYEEKMKKLDSKLASLMSADISFLTLSCTEDAKHEDLFVLQDMVAKKLLSCVLPITWRAVMRDLMKQGQGCDGAPLFLRRDEVSRLSAEHLPHDKDGRELRAILRYSSATSQMIWLEGTHLEEFIFHDPQRIVDACKKLLHHEKNEAMERALGKSYYKDHLEQYFRGYLYEDFLARLLGHGSLIGPVCDLMKQFNLLCPLSDLATHSRRFVVPSNLPKEPPSEITKLSSNSILFQPSIIIRISFPGSLLPQCFFETNLVSVLTWADTTILPAEAWKDGLIVWYGKITVVMKRFDNMLEVLAFGSATSNLWDVLKPVIKRINDNVYLCWEGALPFCTVTCPGCRCCGMHQLTPDLAGRRIITLDELSGTERPPTSLPWHCRVCNMQIPQSLYFSRLPGPLSEEDEAQVCDFLKEMEVRCIEASSRPSSDDRLAHVTQRGRVPAFSLGRTAPPGTTSSLPGAETTSSPEPAPKRRRTDSSKVEGAAFDETDVACNQLTIGMQFKKTTATLIQKLGQKEILAVADRLYQDGHITLHTNEEIVNEANSSRERGARSLILFLSRQGDNMITAFLQALSENAEREDLAELVRNAAIP